MLAQLILGTNRKRFFVYAITVAVCSILIASTAKAKSTWTITVVATGSKSKPSYNITMTGSNICGYSIPADFRNLYVCQGDDVFWTVKSTGNPAQFQMYVYHEDPIILQNNNPIQWFDISDTKPQDGGTVTSDGSMVLDHKYYVAVFDKNSHRLYVEDPKVIIGTGKLTAEVKAIRAKCGDLEKLVTEDKEKAKAICNDIEKRLNQLLPPK